MSSAGASASGRRPAPGPARLGGQTSDEPVLHVASPPLLVAGVMLASVLQVLDTTIANVAVPHMQSALGATPESVMWVLTSYIIAAAVATPLTGWLSDRIGARELFILAVTGFVGSSVLCGIAQNLEQMVMFRIMQGISGAFIAPLSQSYMLDTTRPSQHAQMMAIWGMGMMVGPILGPVLGGWLTENWNWRFVFYVNLPVGLLALFVLITNLPSRAKTQRRFDLFGFAFLSLALASLQLLLDRGNHVDWFDSLEVWIYTGVFLSSAWITVLHFIGAERPLLDMRLFSDRNFTIAMGFMIILGAILYATMALLPPMLQNLQDYSVIDTGLVLMPRGIGTIISMQVGGFLLRRNFDLRLIIGSGVVISSIALWQMAHWSLAVDKWTIIHSGLIQGVGFGLIFIPLNVLAFSTLPPKMRTEGSSILNLFRSVGSSFGISLVTVALARNMQTSHADLASHITSASGAGLIDFSTIERFQSAGEMAMAAINAEVSRQAAMVAYIDDFYLMFWFSLASLPLVLLMKSSRQPPDEGLMHEGMGH